MESRCVDASPSQGCVGPRTEPRSDTAECTQDQRRRLQPPLEKSQRDCAINAAVTPRAARFCRRCTSSTLRVFSRRKIKRSLGPNQKAFRISMSN